MIYTNVCVYSKSDHYTYNYITINYITIYNKNDRSNEQSLCGTSWS